MSNIHAAVRAVEFTPPPRPSRWTNDLCEAALVEAMRVDYRQPRLATPKPPGSASPAVVHSDDDREGWEPIALDVARIRPCRDDEARADRILGWLRLINDDDLRVAVRDWLRTESRGESHGTYCRSKGLLPATFAYRKARALEQIAARLNRDGVCVFSMS